MAWRPDHLVQRGFLDNTQFGWTTGWLELSDREQRVNLKLIGNCSPDLAGYKFTIERLSPTPEKDFDDDEPTEYSGLDCQQAGYVGTITVSELKKQFELPERELIERLESGADVPFQWRKCLYIEWFGSRNGRIVVECTRLHAETIGERCFELTDEQWQEQQNNVRNEMDHFLLQLRDRFSSDG